MADINLEKQKQKAEEIYKQIGRVHCPYFGEDVAFNSKGLKHIKFKSQGKARERKDQYMRLKNIYLAPEVLGKSATLQEFNVKKVFVKVKTNTREERVLKSVRFYGFTSILKDGNVSKRLKIIVREVEGGRKHFWSIVPFWQSNKELRLHSGNLEQD